MTPTIGTSADTPAEGFTLKAAALHVGVSTSTVRRRKDALVAAGAVILPTGWSIPLKALETVFVTLPDTPAATPSETLSETPAESPLVAQLRSENGFLRQQLEQQARTIERQAEAHAVISAQLTQLGQIEAGSSTTPAPKETAPRKRWWNLR